MTGPNNRLLSDGVFTYTYDGEGNRIRKELLSSGDIWVYAYDHNNQLISAQHQATVAGPIDKEMTFRYDVFQNRIESSFDADGAGIGSAVPTRYAFDGIHVWADLNGSSSLTTRRIFGDQIDQVLARITSITVDWYLQDRLGSVREIADNITGTLIYEVKYGGFGTIEIEVSAANGDCYKFTGREWFAAIDLYDYRARVYDAAIGRFVQEDPIFFKGGDANLYRYVHNSPTNGIDPTGRYIITRPGNQDAWLQWLWANGINASAYPIPGSWYNRGLVYIHIPFDQREKFKALIEKSTGDDKFKQAVLAGMGPYDHVLVDSGWGHESIAWLSTEQINQIEDAVRDAEGITNSGWTLQQGQRSNPVQPTLGGLSRIMTRELRHLRPAVKPLGQLAGIFRDPLLLQELVVVQLPTGWPCRRLCREARSTSRPLNVLE